MWRELILITSVTGICLGASLELCPEGSSCHSANERLETSSFEFLNKYTQKDYRSIGSLIITNASINKVDPKLKYLKNLVYLDLSYNNVQISSIPTLNSLKTLILKANNLKNINISLLPQNVEHLDLSDNLLSQIPREWRLLKNLKTLDMYKNPIDCDCNNVLNYDRLIKSGIIVPKPLTCHSPLKYAGKDVTAVNCSISDIMLDDEAEEGSGDIDIFDGAITETKAKLALFNEEEEEDDSLDKNTIVDDKEDNLLEAITTEAVTTIEEEGSGDTEVEEEGSGYGVQLPDSGVLGCMINCSTPSPLAPDSSGSPLPSIFDQFNIILDDLNVFKDPVQSTSKAPSIEPKIFKENSDQLQASKDVELIENGTKTGELEKATIAPKNSTAVYAVLGVGVFFAVIFIIAYVKKRNSKRNPKNRRELPGALGEEMKPLGKPPITALNEKPVKDSSNISEQMPLINGQNGKSSNDTPKLKSFTPLAHPELPIKIEVEDDIPLQNGPPFPKQEEIELRPKMQPELLTPQRERVTIKESEIPDSIPRTPLLVHRQKNSEGEIVTTLVP